MNKEVINEHNKNINEALEVLYSSCNELIWPVSLFEKEDISKYVEIDGVFDYVAYQSNKDLNKFRSITGLINPLLKTEREAQKYKKELQMEYGAIKSIGSIIMPKRNVVKSINALTDEYNILAAKIYRKNDTYYSYVCNGIKEYERQIKQYQKQLNEFKKLISDIGIDENYLDYKKIRDEFEKADKKLNDLEPHERIGSKEMSECLDIGYKLYHVPNRLKNEHIYNLSKIQEQLKEEILNFKKQLKLAEIEKKNMETRREIMENGLKRVAEIIEKEKEILSKNYPSFDLRKLNNIEKLKKPKIIDTKWLAPYKTVKGSDLKSYLDRYEEIKNYSVKYVEEKML